MVCLLKGLFFDVFKDNGNIIWVGLLILIVEEKGRLLFLVMVGKYGVDKFKFLSR